MPMNKLKSAPCHLSLGVAVYCCVCRQERTMGSSFTCSFYSYITPSYTPHLLMMRVFNGPVRIKFIII